VLVLITAVFYMLGMELLEGQHRTFWEAVQWSAGTISTTGYGPDTFWHHPGWRSTSSRCSSSASS
jgi:hypothetical protein